MTGVGTKIDRAVLNNTREVANFETSLRREANNFLNENHSRAEKNKVRELLRQSGRQNGDVSAAEKELFTLLRDKDGATVRANGTIVDKTPEGTTLNSARTSQAAVAPLVIAGIAAREFASSNGGRKYHQTAIKDVGEFYRYTYSNGTVGEGIYVYVPKNKSDTDVIVRHVGSGTDNHFDIDRRTGRIKK